MVPILESKSVGFFFLLNVCKKKGERERVHGGGRRRVREREGEKSKRKERVKLIATASYLDL